MKKTFLFCTRIWFYLCEIPPLLLLIISISHNDESTSVLKLYPLIIFACACIIFIFLYFFRMIVISNEEIRTVGLFSSRDCAVINKDKTLIFTFLQKRKIKVTLFGHDDTGAGFSWAKNDEGEPMSIDLFREKAVGSESSVKRVLRYFGVMDIDINSLLCETEFLKEYECFTVCTESVDGKKEIRIKFTETI